MKSKYFISSFIFLGTFGYAASTAAPTYTDAAAGLPAEAVVVLQKAMSALEKAAPNKDTLYPPIDHSKDKTEGEELVTATQASRFAVNSTSIIGDGVLGNYFLKTAWGSAYKNNPKYQEVEDLRAKLQKLENSVDFAPDAEAIAAEQQSLVGIASDDAKVESKWRHDNGVQPRKEDAETIKAGISKTRGAIQARLQELEQLAIKAKSATETQSKIAALEEQIAGLREGAVRQKFLVGRGIKTVKIIAGATFLYDGADKIYIWLAKDKQPTLFPAGTEAWTLVKNLLNQNTPTMVAESADGKAATPTPAPKAKNVPRRLDNAFLHGN